MTQPVRHRQLVAEALLERRDLLICPPGHALAQRRQVPLEEVAQQPLLALERGSTSRHLLDQAFHRRGLTPLIAMNLGGIEVIKRFVEIGLGVALVPEVAVADEVARHRLVAVRVRGLTARHIGLVERRGRRRSAAAQAFVDLLRGTLPARGGGG